MIIAFALIIKSIVNAPSINLENAKKLQEPFQRVILNYKVDVFVIQRKKITVVFMVAISPRIFKIVSNYVNGRTVLVVRSISVKSMAPMFANN